MSRPLPHDVLRRDLLARVERAVCMADRDAALAACVDILTVLDKGDHDFLAFAAKGASTSSDEGPRRIRSRFETRCSHCSAQVRVDDECVWQRGIRGVLCVSCGGDR